MPVVTLGEAVPFITPVSSDNNSLSLSLTQPLFTGFNAISLFRQAGLQVTAQKSAYRWAYKQLYLDTSQSYFDVLALLSDLNHYTGQVGIYDKRIRDLDNWVSIGKIRSGDLVAVKAARYVAEAQRVQTAGAVTNALKVFTFVTGLSNGLILSDTVSTNILVLQLAEYINAVSNREDLRAGRFRLEAAKKNIDAAVAGRWPSLGVSGGMNIPNWFDVKNTSLNLGLSLTLSLFPGDQSQERLMNQDRFIVRLKMPCRDSSSPSTGM